MHVILRKRWSRPKDPVCRVGDAPRHRPTGAVSLHRAKYAPFGQHDISLAGSYLFVCRLFQIFYFFRREITPLACFQIAEPQRTDPGP